MRQSTPTVRHYIASLTDHLAMSLFFYTSFTTYEKMLSTAKQVIDDD